VYVVESELYDVADQVVVLEENCVFYFKSVIEVSDNEFGICFAYEPSYTNFTCQ